MRSADGRKYGAEKISEVLLPKQHIVSPTFWGTIFVKFEHKTQIGVATKTFGTQFRDFFSKKGHFP